jgi:hypothetical protein
LVEIKLVEETANRAAGNVQRQLCFIRREGRIIRVEGETQSRS